MGTDGIGSFMQFRYRHYHNELEEFCTDAESEDSYAFGNPVSHIVCTQNLGSRTVV